MQINTQTSAAGYPGTGAAGIFSTKVYSAKNTEAAEASKRAGKEPTNQEQFQLAADVYKENHRLNVEKAKKEDDWREMTDDHRVYAGWHHLQRVLRRQDEGIVAARL